MGRQKTKKEAIIEIRKFAIKRSFVDAIADPKRVRNEIERRFGFLVSTKSLKRWLDRFEKEDCWNFEDRSRRPKTIRKKVTPELEDWIVR